MNIKEFADAIGVEVQMLNVYVGRMLVELNLGKQIERDKQRKLYVKTESTMLDRVEELIQDD